MASTTALRPHRLRRLHWQTLVKAVEYAQHCLDKPQIVSAASRFFRRELRTGRDVEALLSELDCEAQFIPWVLWDAQIDHNGALGRVLAAKARNRETREILAALLSCRPEVWRFDRVQGETATLTRLRDGCTAEVTEPALAFGAVGGELMIARVADLGDLHLLDAVHETLPARCEATMKKAAMRIARMRPEAQLYALRRAALVAVTDTEPKVDRPTRKSHKAWMSWVFAVDLGSALPALERQVAAGTLQVTSRRSWQICAPAGDLVGCTVAIHRGRLHVSAPRQQLGDTLCAWVQAHVAIGAAPVVRLIESRPIAE